MREQYPLITAAWEQNRIRLIVIGVLLLCVVGIFIAQRSIVEPNLLSLRTEQSRLQQHVRQRQMEFANSGFPVSAAEQIEKNLQQFDQIIPLQADFSTFLGELFAWSQQAGLEIHQINYQPEKEKESGFLRYGLNFSVKGSYAQVKQFVHLLENARRIVLIEKISLSGAPARNKGEHDVDLKVELATYFKEGSA